MNMTIQRSHSNPRRALKEINDTIRHHEANGWECVHPVREKERFHTDQYWKSERRDTICKRNPGQEYKTYYVKMRRDEE